MTDPVTAASVEAVRVSHRSQAAWPYQQLDLPGLRAGGWVPTPFSEVVLKVHQRCNLACDYCYVYTQADQSWRERPAIMSAEIRRAAVSRIGRHARTHGLSRVRVILHGGEPLLYGADRLGELAGEIRAELSDVAEVEIGMQTNGVRLDARIVGMLVEHRIRTGVSLDGSAADHDRFRRMPNGRGSFAAAAQALELLGRPENRAVYAGILCTVSPDTDPVACLEQLEKFEPPMIDFLFPHANWQSPPWRPDDNPTAYADWLIAVFDHWYGWAGSPPTRVRLFEDVMRLVLKSHSGSEQIGLSPSAVLVVETDGAIEQVDALKSAYEGGCATGLSVLRDDFDVAMDDPGVAARQIGLGALSDTCLSCRFHTVCGAGHYAHRYRAGEGFRQPSVYCADLAKLIDHIHRRLEADIQRLLASGEA
jgi:uncharacterized protein